MPKFEVTLYRPVTDILRCRVEIEAETREKAEEAAIEHVKTHDVEWHLRIEGEYGPIDRCLTDVSEIKESGPCPNIP